MKILMGFIKQDSGIIYFDSMLGKSRKEIFKNIGFLPESPYFVQHITGKEFAYYLCKLNDMTSIQIRDKLSPALVV